ncbi:hypothetical protein [Caulobacter sp.]|uniref:hypothetical protein n=1 Tax=Caulobacter sp. TaxID=78 RepID=UPI001611A71A
MHFRWMGAGLLVLLAACAPRPEDQARRSIESGEAVREIQAHFDKDPRQCTPVLTGVSPIEISADSLDLRGVRALLDAGLLERDTGAPEGQVRFKPTAMARADFRARTNARGKTSAELCYARRQITRAWPVGDDGKILNFAYRLVDSPAWARDPRLQAAFPFLGPALSQELVATGIVPFRDGHWFLDLADSEASLPSQQEGFWACPDDPAGSDRGCRS